MSFEADISKFVNKSSKKAELAIRKIGVELFSRVVLKSPVDTGRFRANWIASINVPHVGDTESVDRGGQAAIAKIVSEVTRYRFGDNYIYLTNNLPYGQRLEFGYSKQAPQGMVRLSLMEIASVFK